MKVLLKFADCSQYVPTKGMKLVIGIPGKVEIAKRILSCDETKPTDQQTAYQHSQIKNDKSKNV